MKLPSGHDEERASDPFDRPPSEGNGAARMTGVLPDDRVCERIDAGDADSLRRLFSRHAPLAITLTAHLVGRSQAQDIVQETFLLLWSRRWHQPDEGSSRAGSSPPRIVERST